MNVERLYHDNGFTSLAAMEQAHAELLSYLAKAHLGPVRSILDLGCGNGILLKKLNVLYPDSALFGLDLVPERIELAQVLCGQPEGHFVAQTLFNATTCFPARRFDLTLLMVGRLSEVDAKTRRRFVPFLRDRGGSVLGYVYGDWLARGMTVTRMAEDLGLACSNTSKDGDITILSTH